MPPDVRRLPVPVTTIWGGTTVAERAAVPEGDEVQVQSAGRPTHFEIDVETLRGCRRPRAHYGQL